MKRKPLYIETKIDCDLDTLWLKTQDPSIHQQWDLRFSEITYLPKDNPIDSQQFLYSTKIGFGIRVKGIGESVATKTKDNGDSTSVLKFSSDSKISLIKEGSGYWKYIPETDGVKFLTGYNYETRYGIFGKVIDKIIFRPLMIWATAWSFDCLKNWIEKGYHPKQAIISQLTVLFANISLGLIWLYSGIVSTQSSLLTELSEVFQSVIGITGVLFGLIFFLIPQKIVHYTNILVLVIAGIVSILLIALPFNALILYMLMIVLSIIAIMHFDFMPKASNCITKKK